MADLGAEAKDREFDYPKARAGGLDVAFMSIYTSPKQDDDGSAWQVANEMIDGVEALVQRHPDRFAILTSPRDTNRLLEDGRVLLPLGMENGAPLGDKLANVLFFFDRGVRYITLAHSAANRIADSSYALEKKWNGLSPFGRDVVREMNRLGIIVDVSHLGDASAKEAIALSTVPVIASHSAFRHFTPGFERNISDDIAKAVAAKGGVVQVPFGTAFIDPASAADTQAHFRAINDFNLRNTELKAQGKPGQDRTAFDKAWNEAHPTHSSTLAQVLDQIDYGVKLIGIDHVGIGSDFDGVDGELPAELKTVADFPHLVAGLQARGYKDADIRKILGGNLLRAWTAIEAGAKKPAR
ncbi:dipeptidase [Thermomonas sp. HDW16]|uniref:dipeptidase n=1 Tax=Thermomonas sp. HDW16 TaxID=2714945 RepID=UPI0014092630|nr:dipeptidase [Thermomonas sp. HDW16]QIL21204.1 membrane dipeptidase [Thermomonas sp. HDW16]